MVIVPKKNKEKKTKKKKHTRVRLFVPIGNYSHCCLLLALGHRFWTLVGIMINVQDISVNLHITTLAVPYKSARKQSNCIVFFCDCHEIQLILTTLFTT